MMDDSMMTVSLNNASDDVHRILQCSHPAYVTVHRSYLNKSRLVRRLSNAFTRYY